MQFLGLAAVQPLYGDTLCLQMRLNLPPYKAGYGPVDILQIYFSLHTSCLTCGTTVYSWCHALDKVYQAPHLFAVWEPRSNARSYHPNCNWCSIGASRPYNAVSWCLLQLCSEKCSNLSSKLMTLCWSMLILSWKLMWPACERYVGKQTQYIHLTLSKWTAWPLNTTPAVYMLLLYS